MATPSSHLILLSISSRIGAIHMRNITGKRGNPCGTPKFVLPSPLSTPSYDTLNFLSFMNSDVHHFHFLSIAVLLIRSSTCVGIKFWNPPLTSQEPHAAFPPDSLHLLSFVTTLNTPSNADLPFTPRNCPLWSRSAPCSSSPTTFSPNLPIQLIRLIGLQLLVFVRSFPGLGIRTTLISFHLSGIFPCKRLVATSSGISLPRQVSFITFRSF